MKTFPVAVFLVILLAQSALAESAHHWADNLFITENDPDDAYIPSFGGSTSHSYGLQDGDVAGRYQFFGFVRFETPQNTFSTGAAIDFTLDSGSQYIGLISESSSSLSYVYAKSGSQWYYDNSAYPSDLPAFIVSGQSSLNVGTGITVTEVEDNFASVTVSLVEIESNTLLLNDCDVDNDGVLDSDDIDLLNLALISDLESLTYSDSTALANVIGMFDVNADNTIS